MTAETLRRAAALMRQQAEGTTPGPWRPAIRRDGSVCGIDGEDGYSDVITPGRVECMSYCYGDTSTIEGDHLEADVRHIASWHPAVALAVADWLDTEVRVLELDGGTPDLMSPHALDVARAYLGDQS